MEINLTILGQAITFAILVWFTMKFVWPPLNNMLEERARKIAEGLNAAEKGRQSLIDAESQVARELQKAQVQISEMMANAKKRSDQIVEEAKVKAEQEAHKILQEAHAKVVQEFDRAKEELRHKVAKLALQGAEQILKAEIDVTKHEAILNNLEI